jgi:Na+/H+ antiporter NhaA
MERRSSHLDYENELVHSKHGALEAESEVQGRLRILPSGPVWEQSVTTSQPGQPFSGRTIWIRKLKTPLREFLRTETGGASVLLFAAIAALVWVNVDASSYDALWETMLSIDVGEAGVALDLRHWVNSGLMTFFFFVLGLEARREFDLGELRERRRFALPLLAAIGGMATAVAIYLAFNMGAPSVQGWGIAMSTDTAFALGLLALVGRRLPDRLRAFILTLVVVDDLLALVVIATIYTEQLKVSALLAALSVFGAVLVVRALRVRRGFVYAVLGAAIWVALLESGVEPVVVGLAMGPLAYAYPVARPPGRTPTSRSHRICGAARPRYGALLQ